MGAAKGGKARKLSEQEFVRETVSSVTGARFEVVAPHPAFPLPVEKLDWFMRCRNKEDIAKAPYLNTVWKEKGDGIWLESLAVGDTIDWIDLAYGEEKAGESLDIDYSSFEDPSVKDIFQQRFPLVTARIREYEEAVAAVAKQKEESLELRRSGSKGMLVFAVAARVKIRKGASQVSIGAALNKSVSALKEAYEKVVNLY